MPIFYKIPGGRGGLGASAHGDINVITGLVASEGSGLEVLPAGGNEETDWFPFTAASGHIVVNVGEMFETWLWTHRRVKLRHTRHRVILPPGLEQRQSEVFFKHFRPEVVVDADTGQTQVALLKERLRAIGLGAAT